MKTYRLFRTLLAAVFLSVLGCSQEDVPMSVANLEPTAESLRSMDELKSYAISAYGKLCGTHSRSSLEVKDIVPVGTRGRSEDLNEIYAVNFENNNGYVLTTTNPKIEPILAVVEEGSFDEEKIPEGVQNFIQAAQRFKPDPIGPVAPIAPVDTNRLNFQYWELKTDTFVSKKIEPQLKVWWGQNNLYNYFTPTYYDKLWLRTEHMPTGCVPTAISMALSFTKHISKLPITFDGRNEILQLNWDEILKHKKYTMRCDIEPIWLEGDCDASKDAHLAIATLLRQVGELCNVQYGENGSSATFEDAYNCLKQLNFDFESASSTNGFTYNRVSSHLNNDEILIMFGKDTRDQMTGVHANHCFIIDGCDCLSYRVTFTMYEEIPTIGGVIRKPLYSYIEEEYASYLAHVVWGFDELGVGYFNDNVLRTISPVKLDEGASSCGTDYSFSKNEYIRIKRPKLTLIPDIPIEPGLPPIIPVLPIPVK